MKKSTQLRYTPWQFEFFKKYVFDVVVLIALSVGLHQCRNLHARKTDTSIVEGITNNLIVEHASLFGILLGEKVEQEQGHGIALSFAVTECAEASGALALLKHMAEHEQVDGVLEPFLDGNELIRSFFSLFTFASLENNIGLFLRNL